ncbi:MAG TPA: DciA family protein [Vicinamibacterales bacterium]
MQPVHRVLPPVLIDLIRRQPTSPAKVDFAWRTAVGPAVARASTATLGPDGELVIEAADAHWAREIQQSLPLVRSRLEMLLGDALASIRLEVRSN